MLTAKEAAEQTGNTKPAILKAIKSGRLSARKNDNGEWEIDPAELFRVYPKAGNQNRKMNVGISPENSGLQHEIELLRERLADLADGRERERLQSERERRQLETVIDDLRQDRDHWRQQATALLTDQRPPEEKAGFWRRLFRKP